MPAAKKAWTADEVRRLNEEVEARGMRWPRYELIDGELLGDEMTPAPNSAHQEVVSFLHWVLRTYMEGTRIGRALTAPADIRLAPDRVVQPDVFVAPTTGGRPVAGWASVHSLLLAIEILSPHSAHEDRVLKRRLYQRAGVPEYWVVDLDGRLIERWRPGDERPEIVERQIRWHPEGAAEPLVIELETLFANVSSEKPPSA